MRRFGLFALVLICMALSASAATWQVTVQDFEFIPASLNIAQGDTVIWNAVQGTHDVHHACDPSLFGNAVATAPWSYQFVFNIPAGTYPYLCEVHPDIMLGTITVQSVCLPRVATEFLASAKTARRTSFPPYMV